MAPTLQAAKVERSNPVQTLGMAILIPYLFVIYSRVFDVKFYWLHVPRIMLGLLIILVPASTRLLKVLRDGLIGRYIALFTIWIFAIIPFAVWRGGAWYYASQTWPYALMDFLSVACMLVTLTGVRRAIYALGFAIIVLSIIGKAYGDFSSGRLMMVWGRFGNPNDLAMALLMGIPCLIFMIMEGGIFIRVLALGGMIPVFGALLRTGSRGGMLGFLVVTIFLFFRCSVTGRLAVAVGSFAVIGAALILLPYKTLERYVTFMHGRADAVEFQAGNPDELDDSGLEDAATGSAQERYAILIDSLKITLLHPITGVGMGGFSTARDRMAREEGKHVRWREAHNAYTQISCETGLVGFLFYMAAFVGTFRALHRLKQFGDDKAHPQWQLISRAVFCLQTSLVGYAATSFFAPVAYQQIFPTLAGMTLALAHAVQPEFSEWERKRTAAAALANGLSRLAPPRGMQPASLPAGRPA